MAEEFSLKTRGNNIVVDMPGTPYRVWPKTCGQLPKTNDPLAGITTCRFHEIGLAPHHREGARARLGRLGALGAMEERQA